MALREQLIDLVYQVIRDINADLPVDQKLAESPDTVLLGFGGFLDSLQLVRLLLSLERKIETAFDAKPALMEDVELLSENGPLNNVGSLSDYLASLLVPAEKQLSHASG
jgi:acyl carrier protein